MGKVIYIKDYKERKALERLKKSSKTLEEFFNDIKSKRLQKRRSKRKDNSSTSGTKPETDGL